MIGVVKIVSYICSVNKLSEAELIRINQNY